MNIEYLDIVFSACLTLRGLHKIRLMQENNVYSMRPQLHIMLVAPFGMGKSSITKAMRNKYPSYIYPTDSFTRAGLEGSIGKDGDYVPSMITKAGGKIMIVDEWNSLDYFAQQGLLSILENQVFRRTIGFKVKKKYSFKSKYGRFDIKDNTIEGHMNFACVAYAMEYPMYKEEQKAKALLSRFSPLFIEPTQEMVEAIAMGDFKININDYGKEIKEVVITKEIYKQICGQFFSYLKEHNLLPQNTVDFGYMTRAMSDHIRLGVYNYMKQNDVQEKNIEINEIKYFTEMLSCTDVLMKQFINPQVQGKIYQFKQLVKESPNRDDRYYANRIGVSEEIIDVYKKKLGIGGEQNDGI